MSKPNLKNCITTYNLSRSTLSSLFSSLSLPAYNSIYKYVTEHYTTLVKILLWGEVLFFNGVIFYEAYWQSSLLRHAPIAVATIEADEAIASSDFLKFMGISPQNGANCCDSGQFWSLRLVWF